MKQRLFVAQIVVSCEDQWFAPGTGGPPIQSRLSYSLDAQLFAALDAEDAYRIVSDWVTNNGFSDSNHDGPSDLTRVTTIGIHQIDEIVCLEDLPAAVHSLYGVSLPGSEVDQEGMPKVRGKKDLEIVRLLALPDDDVRS